MSITNGTDLIVRGSIIGAGESSFEGKVSKTVQFMKKNARGKAELINVKLDANANLADYPEGKTVEIAVDVLSFEGTLYYRAHTPAKPAAETAAVNPATRKA